MKTDVIAKPLKAWVASDVERICAEAMPEGADLEFKRTLAAKDGKPDVWMATQNDVGHEAKEKLVREIIAFANSHGGVLILGIEETESKPARAQSITPIPKCSDLADRLRLVVRDVVEPKLAIVDIEGIPTASDGSGVVVFSVPPSRAAPHRNSRTKECYVRRGDRSEAMTMREIQDLTLFVERGLASIESQFDERKRKMSDRTRPTIASDIIFLLRITTLPLVPLRVHRVHAHPGARPEVRSFSTNGDPAFQLTAINGSFDRWRPFIGGTRATNENNTRTLEVELRDDGLIEMMYVVKRPPSDEPRLFLSWFAGLVSSALLSAHKFRTYAGSGTAETGVDVELFIGPGWVSLIRLGDRHGVDVICKIPPGHHHFPRHSIGDSAEMNPLLDEIIRDLVNAGGEDFDVNLNVDFQSHMSALGLS